MPSRTDRTAATKAPEQTPAAPPTGSNGSTPTAVRETSNGQAPTQTQQTNGQAAANGNGTPHRHAQQSPKTIKGVLKEDPEARFTPSGKLVAKLRIIDDAPDMRHVTPDQLDRDGKLVWTTTMWEPKAENAIEQLRAGDHIRGIGRREPDRSYTNRSGEEAWTHHEMTLRDIGVTWGDKTIPIDTFDRSTPATTLAPTKEAGQEMNIA